MVSRPAAAAASGIGYHPAISIMVPVRGADHDTYSNFARLCRQDYPSYEIIFGASDDLTPQYP
jgi:ceramide glucosyltransferase